MAGDLGTDAGEVHENARAVLDFWFALSTEQQFAKDEALDDQIRRRFGRLRDDVVATRAAGWRGHPDTLLAAIILIDQFSRNMHRGDAKAFSADDLGAELTLLAIDRGWDARYPAEQRAFLYMPLMHAEDMPLQRLSVEKFEALGDETYLHYAREHADVIDRFGRFPSRNAALARASGPDEEAYLSQPDAGW